MPILLQIIQNFSVILNLTGAITGTMIYFILPGSARAERFDKPTSVR